MFAEALIVADEIYYLRESQNCPRTFDTNFNLTGLFLHNSVLWRKGFQNPNTPSSILLWLAPSLRSPCPISSPLFLPVPSFCVHSPVRKRQKATDPTQLEAERFRRNRGSQFLFWENRPTRIWGSIPEESQFTIPFFGDSCHLHSDASTPPIIILWRNRYECEDERRPVGWVDNAKNIAKMRCF